MHRSFDDKRRNARDDDGEYIEKLEEMGARHLFEMLASFLHYHSQHGRYIFEEVADILQLFLSLMHAIFRRWVKI